MFLRIDSSLKNWIFISLTLIAIYISLLKKYLSKLYTHNFEKKKINRIKIKKDFNYNKEVKNKDINIIIKNAINRENLLKNNFIHFSQKEFKQRKELFYQSKIGFFSQKFDQKISDLMNQNMNREIMKKKIINGLFYILLLIGLGYIFSYFILLKLQFNLTIFSIIHQRLNFSNINIFYINIIIWCLILVFGLNSFFQFFNGITSFIYFNPQKEIMNQSSNLINNPMNEANYDKILQPEKENFKILPDLFFNNKSVDKLIEI